MNHLNHRINSMVCGRTWHLHKGEGGMRLSAFVSTIVCLCFVFCIVLSAGLQSSSMLLADTVSNTKFAAGLRFQQVAVVGEADERLQGSRPLARRQLGELADVYLGRALRVSFPQPGSLVSTATPVCFADIVVTVAHIYANVGDNTAQPLGLRISVPDIEVPGKFRSKRTVADFHASTTGRQYDPNDLPFVRDDFLVLSLTQPLPADVVPIGLLPYSEIKDLAAPAQCLKATVNAAYHADLGLLGNVVVNTSIDPGAGRITAAGQTPLVTVSTGMSEKVANGDQYGDWYTDPLVGFPQHDTHQSASGSAVVCPQAVADGRHPRDYLLGIMVGQMFLETLPVSESAANATPDPANQDGYRPAINVATFNLAAIYQAIAALKGLPVDTLHEQCAASVYKSLHENNSL